VARPAVLGVSEGECRRRTLRSAHPGQAFNDENPFNIHGTLRDQNCITPGRSLRRLAGSQWTVTPQCKTLVGATLTTSCGSCRSLRQGRRWRDSTAAGEAGEVAHYHDVVLLGRRLREHGSV